MTIGISNTASAGKWVDVDGGTIVVIEDQQLSIYSLDNFYYFDEIFSDVRKGAKLFLCIGPRNDTGISSDCLGPMDPSSNIQNGGFNRSIHFNIDNYRYIFQKVENDLKSGVEISISFDNGDLYAQFDLRRDYILTDKSEKILERP